MQKILLVYEEMEKDNYADVCIMLEEILNELGMQTERLCIVMGEPTQKYVEKMQSREFDYICSLDMAGFQISTLLDIPAYNIIPAKQIHIVVDERIMSLCEKMEMALNLYLYIPKHMKHGKLNLSHLPNLKKYETLEKNQKGRPIKSAVNRDILKEIINEVIADVEGR